MVRSFIAVGSGAAIGAWMRWGLSAWLNPSRSPVPLGTLAANLVGGYVVGIALGWIMSRPGMAPEWRLFLVTGLLGGLTTFSTFSAEIVQQLTRQQYGAALLGVILHLFGSLLLTVLGLYTWRVLRFGG
ncbi:fluoride efflux transporter CrcB [Pseudoxanthomonas koreensis]|uniref:fluoride efflux transporter CrcB n=1 Tax=Pseudoxanthomonas koreensis TaxID=266061 RepID=UPI001391EDF7|nr:fluoride efflux transporter CrcB [Pseudoxanthomonas koreensis]KAF1690644.1 fluoride efflux transporter CrcB [Pseudoxanthomonas koreensis]